MKGLDILFSILLVTFLLTALGFGCYYTFVYAAGFFRGLETEVRNAIYAVGATGVLAILLASFVMRRLEMRAKRRLLLQRKAGVYRKFITTWASLIRQSAQDDQDLSQLGDRMEDIEKDFILLADPGVVKKYIELQSGDNKASGSFSIFGQLVLEIRRDLGNSNLGLDGDDVAALFLDSSAVGESGESGVAPPARPASTSL